MLLALAVVLTTLLAYWWFILPEQLMRACLERQEEHEKEHRKVFPHAAFTNALRVENIANRYVRKMKAARLPIPSKVKARKLAKEALCRYRT